MNNVRGLIFNNYVIHKNIQWFWSLNFNALFSRSMESGAIKRWGKYFICKETAFSYVVLYHDKIIAVPRAEKKILIFDIETDTFRYVNLKLDFIENNPHAFFSYVVVDKWLFVIGNETSYILKFNMDAESVEGVLDLGMYVSARTIYFREAVLDKDKLILPLVEENLVFEIDIETLQWQSGRVGASQGGFSAICRDENNIWLMPEQKGAVLQWNRENGNILVHEIEKKGFKYASASDNFHSGIFIGNKVWMFPFYGNIVLSFDLETGEVSNENAINRYLYKISPAFGRGRFQTVQVEQECIFLLCGYSGEGIPLMYHPATDKLEILEWQLEISYEEYLNFLFEKGLYIVNEKDISLENFLGRISAYDVNENNNYCQIENNNGDRIWKATGNCI